MALPPIAASNDTIIAEVMKRKRFIVKVQRSLYASANAAQCLIYNEDRSLLVQFPLDPELRRAMGKEHKQFWYAYRRGTELHLDGLAPEQEW